MLGLCVDLWVLVRECVVIDLAGSDESNIEPGRQKADQSSAGFDWDRTIASQETTALMVFG